MVVLVSTECIISLQYCVVYQNSVSSRVQIKPDNINHGILKPVESVFRQVWAAAESGSVGGAVDNQLNALVRPHAPTNSLIRFRGIVMTRKNHSRLRNS